MGQPGLRSLWAPLSSDPFQELRASNHFCRRLAYLCLPQLAQGRKFAQISSNWESTQPDPKGGNEDVGPWMPYGTTGYSWIDAGMAYNYRSCAEDWVEFAAGVGPAPSLDCGLEKFAVGNTCRKTVIETGIKWGNG